MSAPRHEKVAPPPGQRTAARGAESSAHDDSALEAARSYVRRGWSPIAVPHRAKAPSIRGWQDLRLTNNDLSKHFDGEPKNVGVLLGVPSGNLVDLDLDSAEAVADAKIAAPPTNAIFGRKGKPSSHRLYRCSDPSPKTTRFVDPVDGEAICEIRSTGSQTLFPPSVHPSGDQVTWESDGEPGVVTAAELENAARAIAATAVLAKHWPAKGRRHDAALALAGGLLRAGVLVGLAEGFVVAIAGIAGDDEVEDRRRAVESTHQRIAAGRPATGWSTLSEIVGNKVVNAVRKWLKIPLGGVPSNPEAILPWRRFPVELLPEPFRSFVDAGAKAIGCDPAFIALPALATAAAAIGTTRCIRLKRSWEEPVMVWALTVGRSGTMRSPAFDLAVKPLRDQQAVAVQEYHDAMKEYEREEIKYEEALKKWKAKTKAKGPKGDPPSKPKRPVLHRYICSDVTVEAIADVLQYAPRGLLLARDELSGLIRSFNAYRQGRGGDEAHWLEMFRAGELLVDRKTARTIYVRRAGVSICGTIQRGTLTRAFGREYFENGMIARFLLCDPPSPKKKWTESDVPRRVEANYAKVIRKLLTLRHTTIDGDPLPVPVRLTDKAKAEWVAFFDEHAAVQADLTDDDLAAAFSKLEGYAARFALIVHLIRRAAGDQTLADAKAVDEQSIRVGVALARWFCHETQRIYQSLGENEQQTEQRRLVDWIQRRGGSVTVREVQQNHRRYATAEEARAALELLVEAEIGKWVPPPPGPKGGRPSERFEVVYSANAYETSTPDSANGGFVDVDAVDRGEGADG